MTAEANILHDRRAISKHEKDMLRLREYEDEETERLTHRIVSLHSFYDDEQAEKVNVLSPSEILASLRSQHLNRPVLVAAVTKYERGIILEDTYRRGVWQRQPSLETNKISS